MTPRHDGLSPEERFWTKVEKTETCWNWTATKRGDGYGLFSLNGKQVRAHRFAYATVNGEIEPGKEIDHRCHNRACVNPDHLRATNRKENAENEVQARKSSKSGVRGVWWYAKTNRWVAQVQHHGRSISVGYFLDIADAEAAVIAKRNELFTHNDADRRAA